jgi:hypothetical protein
MYWLNETIKFFKPLTIYWFYYELCYFIVVSTPPVPQLLI